MGKSALIIGSGPRVGIAVARKLQSEGYKVAVGSRKPDVSSLRQQGFVPFAVDASVPESVPGAIEGAVQELGTFPEVFVYNVAVSTFSDPADLLASPTTSALASELATNVVSAHAAASTAVAGWSLPANAHLHPSFIYTGNPQPWIVFPQLLSAGLGKAAAAKLIATLAEGYKDKGFRFYFAYEVLDDGGISLPITGEAVAENYWRLANEREQGEWEVTFTSDGRTFSRGRKEGEVKRV